MKNYYIVKNIINDYLCVDVKHCCETRWTKSLPNIFTEDFCDHNRGSEGRFHNHPAYIIIAEFDELPSSYEEFVQLYPEFCI